MNTSNPNSVASLRSSLLFLATLFAVVAFCSVAPAAQETNGNPASVTAPQTESGSSDKHSVPQYSSIVSEVVEMADAGVSGQILKTYIECSAKVSELTDVDVIALKKHHVSDDVVTLLLKRGAQARAAIAQARADALARALSTRRMVTGGMDPQSYDYFQYYYLQPRAVASAYGTLYPYYSPTFGYPYGYPRPFH